MKNKRRRFIRKRLMPDSAQERKTGISSLPCGEQKRHNWKRATQNNCEQLQMTIEERRAKNAERMRAWRARNPERANAIAAAGRRRNRAKIAAYRKIYYEKNKATLYEKRKSY